MDVFTSQSLQRNHSRLLELRRRQEDGNYFPRGDAPEKVAKNSVAVGTIKREQEVKKDGRKEKPNRPISVIYADAKQAITRQVGNTMAAYGLPIFMAEGILSGVLAEIRANAANELADDTARYEEELKAHYEAEMKEKQEAFEKKRGSDYAL